MPTDPSTRTATLGGLDPFVGTWRVEASFPNAPPTGIVGITTFSWILNGAFLAQRTEIPHPDAPDSTAIIEVDPGGTGFTQHYFDQRGVARVYAMTFQDGVWTLLRVSPDFSPLDFCQRFTGDFRDDGNTIAGRWETSPDGSSWNLDFDLTYTRAR